MTAIELARLIAPIIRQRDNAEHLKADGYRFPVMVITAFPNDHIRDRAMQVGASCFLTKPFSHESFTECLERALTSLSKPLHN
jgi:FixJ family two-component response regulator